jgi:ABC-type sugar transport system ATPase subunit
MTMADRIAVLHEGKLQQVGAPEELYLSPDNLFVAGFMGTPPMNFLEVSLETTGGACFLHHECLRVPLSPDRAHRIGQVGNRRLVLGLRPEDIKVEPEQPSEAEVYVVEPLGRETLVTIKVRETMLKALAPPEVRLRPGDRVRWHVLPDRVYLFDSTSGEALLVPGW